jgi:hypothetical protein
MRRLRPFGDGLVAEVVEAESANRGGGALPGCDRTAETFVGFERLFRGFCADAPGGFANLKLSRGA